MAMSSSATQAVEPEQPQKQDTTATNNASAAPRKRRRRAPATGASEDCFACKKRQVKCDRRRPYCGQCVEMGKECSGYKTTLTWGVGVASRGKLRGMSLPVPKSPTQTSTANRDSKTQTSNASTSASSAQQQNTAARVEPRRSVDFGLHSPTSPTSPQMYSAPQEYLHLGPTSPIPIPSPTTPMGLQVPGYGEHVDAYHPHSSKLRRPHLHRGPLQRLHTSLAVPFEETGLSASTGSMISDTDYPSPTEYPHTPDDFPFADTSLPPYNHSLLVHDQTPMSSTESLHFHDHTQYYSVPDDMSSSISSDQSIQDYAEVTAAQQQTPMGPPSFSDIFMEGELNSNVNGLSQSGFAYLPTEEYMSRYANFPADAIPAGLLRQIYMPGARGF